MSRSLLKFPRRSRFFSAAFPTFRNNLLVYPVVCPWIQTNIKKQNNHSHQKRYKSSFEQIKRTENENADVRKELPPPLTACPGCGALAQVIEPGGPGYYSRNRNAVRAFIEAFAPDAEQKEAKIGDDIASRVTKDASPEILESLGLKNVDATNLTNNAPSHLTPPVCDRCHQLLHHSSGTAIHHPSVDAMQDTIAESPWRKNHIYHILDAADFPLSLVPNIHRLFHAAEQRSRNRRAVSNKYIQGRQTEISFVITRADLLAPWKAQVDALMPYLREVLREALGLAGDNVRLGNVRCVSAKRGWWTPQVKEEVWEQGGGCWMLGKVNVGKSNLFATIFPKGRNQDVNIQAMRAEAQVVVHAESKEAEKDDNVLLPPARPETAYPMMPTVNHLPGTTASPIRIPFGNGKGELIDLPGLARCDLSVFVRDEEKQNLVMNRRKSPEQHTIKPGQSLLLGGGLIRITPTDSDTIILAYPFVPLKPHVTSTEKAIGIQSGERETGIDKITTDDFGGQVASAGKFKLAWDVTKERAGPLTRKDSVALKPSELSFAVLSADILIESVGWVELVAQVRRKNLSFGNSYSDEADGTERTQNQSVYPEVEVFSPDGKYVAVRKPLGAWLLDPKNTSSRKRARPRRSMRSLKQSMKGRAQASSDRS